MEPRARYVTIGLFTLISIICILLAIIWLGKMGKDVKWRPYIVEFNESVSGLTVGSDVQYSGLKVGEVTRLELVGSNPYKVQALVNIRENLDVRKDIEARLSIVGITGRAVIALSGGSPESPVLYGDSDHIPVIVATPSILSELFQNGGGLMSNLSETLLGVKNLLSHENITEISKIIKNIAGITGAVSSQDEVIKKFIQEINQFAVVGNNTIKSLQDVADTFNGLLNNSGKEVFASASKAMKSFEQASREINKVIGSNQGKFSQGMKGFQQIGPALVELKNSLGTMQLILQKFESNPASYLLNGESLKEFKP